MAAKEIYKFTKSYRYAFVGKYVLGVPYLMLLVCESTSTLIKINLYTIVLFNMT